MTYRLAVVACGGNEDGGGTGGQVHGEDGGTHTIPTAVDSLAVANVNSDVLLAKAVGLVKNQVTGLGVVGHGTEGHVVHGPAVEVDACGAQGVGSQHGAVSLGVDRCGAQGSGNNSVTLGLVGGCRKGGLGGGSRSRSRYGCRSRCGNGGGLNNRCGSGSFNDGRCGLNGGHGLSLGGDLGLLSGGRGLFYGGSFNGRSLSYGGFFYSGSFFACGLLNCGSFLSGGCLFQGGGGFYGGLGGNDVGGDAPDAYLAFTGDGEALEGGGGDDCTVVGGGLGGFVGGVSCCENSAGKNNTYCTYGE